MSAKRIAVNTRFLLKDKLEGIGWFSFETLKRITQQQPGYQFYFLFDRPFSSEFIFSDNIEPIVVSPPARHPFLWYTWFELALPRKLKTINPDLFLSTDGYCSLASPVKTYTVFHDIAFEHYPEQVPYLVRKYYQHYTPKYAHKSDRIGVVSNYTKQDMVQKYELNPNKIDVVPNGIHEAFSAISKNEIQGIRDEVSEGQPYFLFVGAIHPRKNMANILRAYDKFRAKSTEPIKMVVAGRKAWQNQEAFEVYSNMKFKSEVIFLGHLSTERLKKVFPSALALTYPSMFEGFGIPIIEAMQCDIPVITSTTSSMPEVAGGAALLVNPTEVNEIETAMTQIAKDEVLRQTLIDKGRIQRTNFSWDKSADCLWKSLQKLF